MSSTVRKYEEDDAEKDKRTWLQRALTTVIEPRSPFAMYARLPVFAGILYNAFWVPAIICWWQGPRDSEIVANYFFDLVFLAHIAISSQTAYMNQGILVRDISKIRRHYARTSLARDLIGSVPVDIIPLAAGFRTLSSLLRVTRVIRLSALSHWFMEWEKASRLNPIFLRLIKLFFGIMLVSHYMACVWWAVGSLTKNDPRGGWIEEQGYTDAKLRSQYMVSLYWSVFTMTTTGFGNIRPVNGWETLFAIFVMFIGQSIYAYIIGSMSNIIASSDALGSRFNQRRQEVTAYVKIRRLPIDLVKRIDDYYNYLWDYHKGVDENFILDELPSALRRDVAISLNAAIVKQVPLFKNCDEAFLAALVERLDPLVVGPADYIIRQGEVGDSMYFISRGEVIVMSGDEKTVYTRLGNGSFFGEIALLTNDKRSATIRAGTFCDLYVLTHDDFEEVLELWPGYKEQMIEVAIARQQLTTKRLEEKKTAAIAAAARGSLADAVREIKFELGLEGSGNAPIMAARPLKGPAPSGSRMISAVKRMADRRQSVAPSTLLDQQQQVRAAVALATFGAIAGGSAVNTSSPLARFMRRPSEVEQRASGNNTPSQAASEDRSSVHNGNSNMNNNNDDVSTGLGGGADSPVLRGASLAPDADPEVGLVSRKSSFQNVVFPRTNSTEDARATPQTPALSVVTGGEAKRPPMAVITSAAPAPAAAPATTAPTITVSVPASAPTITMTPPETPVDQQPQQQQQKQPQQQQSQQPPQPQSSVPAQQTAQPQSSQEAKQQVKQEEGAAASSAPVSAPGSSQLPQLQGKQQPEIGTPSSSSAPPSMLMGPSSSSASASASAPAWGSAAAPIAGPVSASAISSAPFGVSAASPSGASGLGPGGRLAPLRQARAGNPTIRIPGDYDPQGEAQGGPPGLVPKPLTDGGL